jgi:pilus assembly protein Flp/PilA
MLSRYFHCVVQFLKEDDGPTAVEYALMLALIVIVCLQAIIVIGQKSNQTFLKVGSAMTTSS